jgi:hypothetical protein
MGAALKAWQDPATTIPPDAPCPTQIYVVWGVDPWERGKGNVCLWVGESARFWIYRIAEHLKDKYWRFDIRVIEILPEVYPTKGDAYVAEQALTKKHQPIHSWEYNKDNPWVVRHKQGVHRPLPRIPAHWNEPLPNGRVPTVPAVATSVRRAPGKPMGSFAKLAWAAAGWLVVAGLVWVAAAATAEPGQAPSAQDGAGVGALTASMLTAGILWVRGKVRTREKRRKS